MRISNTPWILATVIMTILLMYTLHKYNKVNQALQVQHDRMSGIDIPNIRQKNPQSNNWDRNSNQVDLQGMFEEHRHIPQVVQNFNPDFIKKEKGDNYNYKTKLQSLINQKVPADNPELVQIIRNYYIDQPSTEEYNLTFPRRVEFSQGQSPVVDSRLNYMVS